MRGNNKHFTDYEKKCLGILKNFDNIIIDLEERFNDLKKEYTSSGSNIGKKYFEDYMKQAKRFRSTIDGGVNKMLDSIKKNKN